MKAAVLVIQTLATVALVLAFGWMRAKWGVNLPYLKEKLPDVPPVYAFSTLAMLLSIASLWIISRGWEKETLPREFIAGTKFWATATLLFGVLPGMIFLSVLVRSYPPLKWVAIVGIVLLMIATTPRPGRGSASPAPPAGPTP